MGRGFVPSRKPAHSPVIKIVLPAAESEGFLGSIAGYVLLCQTFVMLGSSITKEALSCSWADMIFFEIERRKETLQLGDTVLERMYR